MPLTLIRLVRATARARQGYPKRNTVSRFDARAAATTPAEACRCCVARNPDRSTSAFLRQKGGSESDDCSLGPAPRSPDVAANAWSARSRPTTSLHRSASGHVFTSITRYNCYRAASTVAGRDSTPAMETAFPRRDIRIDWYWKRPRSIQPGISNAEPFSQAGRGSTIRFVKLRHHRIHHEISVNYRWLFYAILMALAS